MRVLLAGGGTAGHIEPALNTADELRMRNPAHDIRALGTSRGLEVRLVPARGYPLDLIPAVPMPRRPNRDLIALPSRLRASVRAVRDVMEQQGTDVVVGFGGYVAMPAYLAARGRVPIVIHEANAKPGLANRVGARFTPYVAQAFPDAIKGAETVGIPLREAIVNLDRPMVRATARAHFGLDPDRPCLLVFGGSQGARRINDAVVAATPRIIGAGFQVLHVVGTQNLDQGGDLPADIAADYHRVAYVDRMDLAYAAADLAICRSGAMTCAELAAVGLPAIYVPLPIGNGEQRVNAAGTVDAGGGKFLADQDMTPDSVAESVLPLLADPHSLETMSLAASSQGVRDAGAKLADIVERAVQSGPKENRK
mgnify:FL=1